MYSIFMVIHVIICLLLIISILVFQTSKGSALSMFGGGGDSLFATTGGTTFIKKFTIYLAIAFALNSLILTALSPTRSKSVLESISVPEMPIKK